MAPGAISRGWRWFSFVFGILVPLIIWGVLAFTSQDSFFGLNFTFVLAEISCLGWFLRSRAPSPLLAMLMSAWFAIGAMYALFWSLLGFIGLTMTPSDVDRPVWGVLLVIALCLSPLPCVPIYFIASLAASNSVNVAPCATHAAEDPAANRGKP